MSRGRVREETAFVDGLLAFLDASPTPWHAVRAMGAELDQAGFRRLDEAESWGVEPGTRGYVTRNDSSLIAFDLGRRSPVEAGLRMVGAHTDSPGLRVKPTPESVAHGCFSLGVEVYGGALLNPWFDRDLSLAGRASGLDGQGRLRSALIDFRDPVAVIPSLAIHLDREANRSRSINPQTDLPPLLALGEGDDGDGGLRALLLERLQADNAGIEQVLDFELLFYDTQRAARIGLRREFIVSARLDNLLSCYIGLHALLDAEAGQPGLLVCNDHEEVGSQSAPGADGPFLRDTLRRVCGDSEGLARCVASSTLVSADNAHAVHPNYADRHDRSHAPQLNGGPVIKVNANQRYATTGETAALFRRLCTLEDVPVQSFVTRTDLACGTTIGPLTAAGIGVRTLDVGVPQLAMHSTRELCGHRDPHRLYRVLRRFYASDD